CAAVVREVRELAVGAACEVHVAAAITVGRAGERLAPLGELADLGVRLFTDDGNGVQDGRLMRRALEYASALDVTLGQHCEAGSRDGIIDAIATDHAPHTQDAKEQSFDDAPPGMLGLETALALAIGELGVDELRLFELLSVAPARIAGLTGQHGVWLEKGAPA